MKILTVDKREIKIGEKWRYITESKDAKCDINEDEIQKAYNSWKMLYKYEELDDSIEIFYHVPLVQKKWIQETREALLLTQKSVAESLGIGRSSYQKIEAAEDTGKVTIENLRKVADAMDCELVYFIRPKNNQHYSKMIWDKVLPYAKKQQFRRQNAANLSAHFRFARLVQSLLGRLDVYRRLGFRKTPLDSDLKWW